MPKSVPAKANVRNIATVQLATVEHHYSGTFTLKLKGVTKTGGKIQVGATMHFDEWPYIADNLTEAYKKHRANLVRSMENMDKAFSFKPGV